MYLIDTHAHIYLDQFNNDRDEIIKRAVDKNVNKIVLPNIDSSTIDGMMNLCNSYPENCFPTIGLHPSSVKDNFKKELQLIENWLKNNKCYAIGETGIDLYWDKTFKKQQIDSFIYQLELSLDYKLPVIIHTRDAFDEIVQVLETFKNKNIKGIFHCFSGTTDQAKLLIEKGFKLGIGGVVTFKNSTLGNTVKNIDLDHIVLETDSPYLAPVPKRGKRNECSYLVYIAQKIAELKSTTIEEVASTTSKNASELFNF